MTSMGKETSRYDISQKEEIIESMHKSLDEIRQHYGDVVITEMQQREIVLDKD